MKKKTKPTSVRLDSELLEELDQRCSKLGCSIQMFYQFCLECNIQLIGYNVLFQTLDSLLS